MKRRRIFQKNSRPFFYTTLAVLFIFLLIATKFIFSYSVAGKQLFSHRNRINFVWNNNLESNHLISLVPGQELLIIIFPEDATILAARGYGHYAINSLWRLAEIENQPHLVAESLQHFVGVPVDGWINRPQSCQVSDPTSPTALKDCLTKSLHPTNQSSFSSYSFWPNLHLYLQVKNIKLTQVEIINLQDSLAAQDLILPGLKEQTTFQKDLLDSVLDQQLFDPRVVKENLTAEVINSTSHPGMANQAARIVSHLGIHVISITSDDQQLYNCLIITSPIHQKSDSVRQLIDIFKCSLKLDLPPQSPSQIRLHLGESFWQSWQPVD
jgi:hypothetical protein